MSMFFGPVTVTVGALEPIITSQFPNANVAVFINESPYTLKVDPGTGSYFVVSAFTQDAVPLGNQFSGVLKVTAAADANFTGASPIMVLYVQVYAKGEPVLGTYPAALTRIANVGNSVPLSASATSVANDGNTNGTPVVEATPSGGSQALLIDNNGNIFAHTLILEQFPASGDTTMFHIDPNAPPGWEWHLDAAGNLYLMEVVSGKTLVYYNGATQGQQLDNGILITDGAGHISSTAAAAAGADDLLSFAPSDDASLNAAWRASGNEMMLWDKSLGARIVSFFMGQAGIKISGTGSRMIAWSFFSGTGSGTFSHGLGLVPNVVLALQSVAGSQTMGATLASATSTTVPITAGAGNAWVALALNMV